MSNKTTKHAPLNTKRKVPKRPPYSINGEVNPEYTIWYKTYCENPLVKRERNRKQAAKTRQKPEWKKYFANYFREYYAKNKDILAIRNITSNIRAGILKTGGKVTFEKTYKAIYDNLLAIGWDIHMNPKEEVVNHKVSIKIIYEFSPSLPRECYYDIDNIEIVKRGQNNSAEKRIITEDTMKVASKLEAKYPHWLRGLTAHLLKMRGDLV